MTIDKKDILDAFRYRHATKRFDSIRKISEDDFEFILETGRLSPSSFGYEPWKFLIIQNQELREKLREVSWGAQGQLTTASHFVIILAKTNLSYDSDYVLNHKKNVQKMPEDIIKNSTARMKSFQESDLPMVNNERAMYDWACRQTYIALGNMMTAAAMIGIDSCPIEGFNYKLVNEILEKNGLLDHGEWRASVMVAFGYRETDPQRAKVRKDIEQTVKWVK
ncbi:NAD(P)H-dependent oxidoreductase [Bacillus sp. JJ1764]|uniref:NAD(P)H-dependent oxidoreductase n=1 Tax=Bacillus sp. JJ1764 TaxID=3122964 RepID=UPI002FFE55BA